MTHFCTFVTGWLLCCAALAQPGIDPYLFEADVAAFLAKDSTAWKHQTAAVNYSFAADYRRALAMWDKALQARAYTPVAADTGILRQFGPADARDYLLRRAKDAQVLILNEAHHNPRHRAFTRSLLAGLYREGYRYLGLEALADSLVNVRNHAVQASGYYTAEPEFGHLIREARRIGFVVFGYEASEGKNGREREIEQAQNIQRFMQAHPEGKYLIHCGFDHAFEQEVQGWEKAMAGRLKEYTGIDPFTVDQVRFAEKSRAEYAHYLVYATGERRPIVLVNPAGEVFNGIRSPQQTDLVVIHPVSEDLHGRPAWLAEGRRAFWLPKKRSWDFPVQVLAYHAGEQAPDCIPADLIELSGPADRRPLYLPEGRYTIVIRNRRYEVIGKRQVRIRDRNDD